MEHTCSSVGREGDVSDTHLVSVEWFGVAQLAELGLGAQQFGLYFWIHVSQKIPHIVRGRHGELWEGQFQRAGNRDLTFFKAQPVMTTGDYSKQP